MPVRTRQSVIRVLEGGIMANSSKAWVAFRQPKEGKTEGEPNF